MTEEYTPVGEVEEITLEFYKERDGLDYSETVFYIPAVTDCCMQYLHRDGEIRTGTSAGAALAHLMEGADIMLKTEQDIWDTYTGYFPTREEAVAVRERYNGTSHYK